MRTCLPPIGTTRQSFSIAFGVASLVGRVGTRDERRGRTGCAERASGRRRPISIMEQPTVTISDGEATVQVRGEFAMEATFLVEPALERVASSPSVEQVVLDLSAVSFIDSTGMGVVMRLAHELQARAIPLRIVPAPPAVHRVFELGGVADALPFERDHAT